MIECSVCKSKLLSPTTRTVAKAYDQHINKISSKQRALNILLVVGDCALVGFQPILVYMSKVDGKFNFSPVSVNFLTEVAKVIFAIVMLLIQVTKVEALPNVILLHGSTLNIWLTMYINCRLGTRKLERSHSSQFPHWCRRLVTMFFLLSQHFFMRSTTI
ncbi:hypothetical protein QQ045_007504 [Rhodiola kirilowii]